MLGSGAVKKRTLGKKIIYEIGELQILTKEPIPDLEEVIGRQVIIRMDPGFPLFRKVRHV